MELVKKVVASSSFWAAVIVGIANGLHAAGVIDEQTVQTIMTVVAVYIPTRLAGDAAKAKMGQK